MYIPYRQMDSLITTIDIPPELLATCITSNKDYFGPFECIYIMLISHWSTYFCPLLSVADGSHDYDYSLAS